MTQAQERLLSAESHFAFGENWRSFAAGIDDARIARSDVDMQRLFSGGELVGKTVIDVGCGSGLPALSMLRLGAEHVTCVDIDENSVAATKETLGRFAPSAHWSAKVASVFHLTGQYDVVYSWGVLHHTGDMWRAIRCAMNLVKPGGVLCIAIYAKGPMCGLWKIEKRLYSRAPAFVQRSVVGLYTAAYVAVATLKGRKPLKYMAEYKQRRGMDWTHDVHDWLGGYPYESATPREIRHFVTAGEFSLARSWTTTPRLSSGCDEFVFIREH